MSVGERIAELRKKRNISQAQIADALDISRQAVSKWENDQSAPDMLNLIRLADLLDTDTEYLATGNHSKTKADPAVVHVIQKVDNVVEKVVDKVVEKPVPVEKIVEVERVVEKIVEIPRIKKIVRIKYLRNPLEFIAVGLAGFVLGILIGFLL